MINLQRGLTLTDKIITDFIDIIGIREEEENGYLTVRFENPITGINYFFRIAKDLFDMAYENRTLIKAEVVMKPDMIKSKYQGDVI